MFENNSIIEIIKQKDIDLKDYIIYLLKILKYDLNCNVFGKLIKEKTENKTEYFLKDQSVKVRCNFKNLNESFF